MKRNIFILLASICSIISIHGAPGDTTIVQTFSFEDGIQTAWTSKTGKFEFPDGNLQYEKVLMYYSLKCDPTKNPACGEWDYIFNTEILEPTGNVDSAGTEIYKSWKLGTYITPYGFGIDLGNSWTWIYDVSDFVHLLKDSVILRDGNFQEMLDIKFAFIEGTPTRNVIEIKKIWDDSYNLNTFDNMVKDTTITLSSNEKQVKLRTTVTGHDFGQGNNCAEFCNNIHSLKVNGTAIRSWNIIQPCATNPLYPQGGTWPYDRAGWCPGMPATVNEFELSEYISNSSINFDYDVESDPYGFYRTYIYLVSYGEINQTDDAAAEAILAPSDNPLQLRYNPTCGNAIIVIKNIGSKPLSSVEIKYGFKNGTVYSHSWQGNLSFLEKDTITLSLPDWDEISSMNEKVFQFELVNPNGKTDPTPYNNKMTSSFEIPEITTINSFEFIFKTNHAPNETSWRLYDIYGNILYQNNTNMSANTEYKTSMELDNGCYRLYLYDSGHNGLKFWANMPPSGSGTSGNAVLKRRITSSIYGVFHQFELDFGQEIQFYFAVNQYNKIEETSSDIKKISVYPNPAQSIIYMNMSNIQGSDLNAEIYDMFGKKILSKNVPELQLNEIDISHLPSGVYIITVQESNKSISRNKFIISK